MTVIDHEPAPANVAPLPSGAWPGAGPFDAEAAMKLSLLDEAYRACVDDNPDDLRELFADFIATRRDDMCSDLEAALARPQRVERNEAAAAVGVRVAAEWEAYKEIHLGDRD